MRISADLSAERDRRRMLEMILTESRRLTAAQAGSLYIRRQEPADELEFVVAQNDAVDISKIAEVFVGRAFPVGSDSLAGFAASAGRIVNIPDSYRLSPGAPYRVNRDFDAATGYRTRSLLALPLKCPDGHVVGVLQLINRIGPGGDILPFVVESDSPVLSLASMAAVSVHNMQLTRQLAQAHLDTIIRLAVVAEFRDSATAEHIRRISAVSAAIARSAGLDEAQVELIEQASPMHDIGKIGIPDAILRKPGPLTPEERGIVETHTLIGAQILRAPGNALMRTAHEIALRHHERWDGKGYPHRLTGEETPLLARIVCLADVFDALATKRCYKEAYPIGEVVKIIRAENGKHFDPSVVDAFFLAFDDIAAMYG